MRNRLTSLTAALALGLFAAGSVSAAALPPEQITVSFDLTSTCLMSTSDIGGAGGAQVGGHLMSTSDGVAMHCNANTAYTITPDNGWNYGADPAYPNLRAMQGSNAGGVLPYELFQNAAGSIVWSAANPITGVGRADGQTEFYTIAVQTYNEFKAPTDDYVDFILVSATYF